MKKILEDFDRVIPRDIYLSTKTFISDQVVIVQPEVYIPKLKVVPDNYHFIIFQSTPPISQIGKKEVQFKKGNLVILEPGVELTTVGSKEPITGQYISITIKKEYFEKICLEATGKDKIKFKNIESSFSWNLLDSVEKFKYEINRFGQRFPTMVHSISVQLVHELLRDTNFDGLNNVSKNDGNKSYIDKVKEYMHGYYNSNISIEEISQIFHISLSHLQRTFKNETGQTPHQYLLQIRINKAKELLLREHYSMGEVARLCGFVNQSHFSTIFKYTTGITPSEYRKTVKTLK